MKCCICKKEIEVLRNPEGKVIWDMGNNAEPVKKGRCCDMCNNTIVLTARIKRL